MRFIDLAHDGGCSKKAPALQLRELLGAVGALQGAALMQGMSKDFPDCGVFEIGNQTFLSTVDVVLPMTISPRDFGRVTALHVLSDLYASGGVPRFALCFLGIPTGMSAASTEAVEALSGAVEELSSEGAVLVGGHTLTDQSDFYLGFSAFGEPMPGRALHKRSAQPGDILIVTKPLGTSVAIGRWKSDRLAEKDHEDVLQGMLHSNMKAAQFLSNNVVNACTDVTGYGLLGHLYNIMYASDTACKISASQVPIYGSVRYHLNPGNSRQMEHNIEYVLPHVKLHTKLTPLMESVFFDSEVSGGLLISVPRAVSKRIVKGLSSCGMASHVIGEVCSGDSGHIDLLG